MTATYGNGAAVSTAGWTFTVVAPRRRDADLGHHDQRRRGDHRRLLLRGEHMARQHRRHHSEHASLQPHGDGEHHPYDFWALTLPHIPQALLFQSVNSGPSTAGAYAIWQINGSTVTGGGDDRQSRLRLDL